MYQDIVGFRRIWKSKENRGSYSMVTELGRISKNLPILSPSGNIYWVPTQWPFLLCWSFTKLREVSQMFCTLSCLTAFAFSPFLSGMIYDLCSPAPHLAMLTFISGVLLSSFLYLAPRNKCLFCFAISNVSKFSLNPPCSTKPPWTTRTWGFSEYSREGTGFGAIWIWVQILAMGLVTLHRFLNRLCFFICKLDMMLPLHGVGMRAQEIAMESV